MLWAGVDDINAFGGGVANNIVNSFKSSAELFDLFTHPGLAVYNGKLGIIRGAK